MDFTLSFIAGFISFAFFIELLNKSIKSKRPSIIFWMVAIGMYSFATLALAVGLYSGWTPFSFAVFTFSSDPTVPITVQPKLFAHCPKI